MPYPQDIDQFTDKLNKKHDGSVYVIEEEVNPSNGIYEAMLNHDNINVKSVQVYTGPKLTGNKIDNFMLSVPAETHWKLLIKIFSSEPKLYVSYETPGDTVEAEDVNLLQDSMIATQEELDRYKAVTDTRTTEHGNRITSVENNKADKTYTDSELLKKADKLNTYTKIETDQRIQNIIGSAPESLDTLQELADALNNDPNFASNIIKQLSSKVDKETGKQLSAEDYTSAEKTKLAGIEIGANKYVHPTSHPATIIAQDANNRFVTDTEKANWNVKETTEGAQAKVSEHANRNDNPHAVTKAQVGLNNVDNVQQATKSEFTTHEGDATRHITAAERTNWNAKETPAGAQAKANSAEANAKSYSDQQLAEKAVEVNNELAKLATKTEFNTHNSDTTRHITVAERSSWNSKATTDTVTTTANGLMSAADKTKLNGVAANANNYTHPTSHSPSIITQDASNRFVTDAEKATWNGKQNALGFTPENPANKGKVNGYPGLDANAKVSYTHLPNDLVKQSDLGNAGFGDMMKSVYDKNNDGVVDRAKTADGVAWTGVTGKPSAMPADGGNSATVGGRSATSFAYSERKDASGTELNTIIQSGMYRLGGNLLNAPAGVTYGQLIVSRGGGDTIAQIVTDYASNNIYWRSGNPTEVGGTGAWRAWRKIWHDGNDGSGSGLDADMLDGKHASEFMKKGPVTWKELKGV